MLGNPDWTFSPQACHRAEIIAGRDGVGVEYGFFLQHRHALRAKP